MYRSPPPPTPPRQIKPRTPESTSQKYTPSSATNPGAHFSNKKSLVMASLILFLSAFAWTLDLWFNDPFTPCNDKEREAHQSEKIAKTVSFFLVAIFFPLLVERIAPKLIKQTTNNTVKQTEKVTHVLVQALTPGRSTTTPQATEHTEETGHIDPLPPLAARPRANTEHSEDTYPQLTTPPSLRRRHKHGRQQFSPQHTRPFSTLRGPDLDASLPGLEYK